MVLMRLDSSSGFCHLGKLEDRPMTKYCYYCDERLVEVEVVMVNGKSKLVCERCKTASERVDHLSDDLFEEEMDRRVDMERKEG